MLWQLDRYVEDQALLLRRKQAAIEERIEEAERRRDRRVCGHVMGGAVGLGKPADLHRVPNF
jgi:hypothetical protein